MSSESHDSPLLSPSPSLGCGSSSTSNGGNALVNGDSQLNLVQEIAASLTGAQQVPERFLHKKSFLPADYAANDGSSYSDSFWMSDLLIDLSLLSAPSTDPSARNELRKLRSALCSWGCFQVKNHGIERELLEKVLEISRGFFALPLEDRRKYVGSADDPFNGYGNEAMYAGSQTINWNDRLYLRDCSEDPTNIKFWPEKPPEFRKIYGEYTNKLESMPKILLKAMARSLELKEEDCFLGQHGEKGSFTGRLNIYPPCPCDRVLGLRPHSDGSTFSVLLQDRQGLQVMRIDDDTWVKVPVIPGALFINIGDLVEIMSNGVIKSAFHKVVTSRESERITLTMFYNPCVDKEIKPVDPLVTADRPPQYKQMTIKQYGEAVFRCYPLGERPLYHFNI